MPISSPTSQPFPTPPPFGFSLSPPKILLFRSCGSLLPTFPSQTLPPPLPFTPSPFKQLRSEDDRQAYPRRDRQGSSAVPRALSRPRRVRLYLLRPDRSHPRPMPLPEPRLDRRRPWEAGLHRQRPQPPRLCELQPQHLRRRRQRRSLPSHPRLLDLFRRWTRRW